MLHHTDITMMNNEGGRGGTEVSNLIIINSACFFKY